MDRIDRREFFKTLLPFKDGKEEPAEEETLLLQKELRQVKHDKERAADESMLSQHREEVIDNGESITRREALERILAAFLLKSQLNNPLERIALNADQNQEESRDKPKLSNQEARAELNRLENGLKEVVKRYPSLTDEAIMAITGYLNEWYLLYLRMTEQQEKLYFPNITAIVGLTESLLTTESSGWELPLAYRNPIRLNAFARLERDGDVRYTNVPYSISGEMSEKKHDKEVTLYLCGQIHAASLETDPQNTILINSQQRAKKILEFLLNQAITKDGMALFVPEGMSKGLAAGDMELTSEEIEEFESQLQRRIVQAKEKGDEAEAQRVENGLRLIRQDASIQLEKKFGDSVVTLAGIDPATDDGPLGKQMSALGALSSRTYSNYRRCAMPQYFNDKNKKVIIESARLVQDTYNAFQPDRIEESVKRCLEFMKQRNFSQAIFFWGQGDADLFKKTIEVINNDKNRLREIFGTENAQIRFFYLQPKIM